MQAGPRYGQHHHHNSYHRNELDRKVVILGQQGVGKSSLVLRYVNSTFHENGASTIGASFLAKKIVVDNATVRLQVLCRVQCHFVSLTKLDLGHCWPGEVSFHDSDVL